MYRVRLLDAASKDLAKLDKPVARRIVDRVRWLAGNLGEANREALTGEFEGLFKLSGELGDLRLSDLMTF
jgi:mRNA interferase RelE/StbE